MDLQCSAVKNKVLVIFEGRLGAPPPYLFWGNSINVLA